MQLRVRLDRRFGLDSGIVALESVDLEFGNGLRFVAAIHFHYYVNDCAAAPATLAMGAS